MRPPARLAVIAAVAGLLVPGPAAQACATGHLGVKWTDFQPPITDLGPVYFYYLAEPLTTSTIPVTIMGSGDDCSNQPVVGTYQVSSPATATNRDATSGLDYSAIFPPRTTPPLYGYHQQGQTHHTDTVPVLGDSLPEPVIEVAEALITGSTGRRDPPFDVPVYIVDDDGADRASFETAGPYERSETYGTISVPVFRGGPAAASATYTLSAAGASSSPATQGADYTLPSNEVSFSAGERMKLVTVQLVDDDRFEQPEELTLTLTNPGTGVLPADPVTATVRILDSVGSTGLQSRLHHPRQGWDYRASDYRIREVHIFTLAGQGAPVSSSQFALRKNLRGGTCEWWTGKRFKKRDCQNERWIPVDGQYEPDFFYIRLKELTPSKGKIKNYTAFSRAQNQTGELESFLEKGRNQNTFEVKPAADGRSG